MVERLGEVGGSAVMRVSKAVVSIGFKKATFPVIISLQSMAQFRMIALVLLLCELSLAFRGVPLSPTRYASYGRLASVRLCDEGSVSIETSGAETAEVQAPPISAQADSWTATEVASGTALFVLLHSITQTGASLLGPSEAAVASARVFSTAAFVAVQQAAGLPAASWLPRGDGDREGMEVLQSPLAPLFACALFAAAAFAPSIGLTATGQVAEAHALLPSARPLPGPGGAFELLLAAPITEEIFVLPQGFAPSSSSPTHRPLHLKHRVSRCQFRGWLLSGMSRAGIADSLALGASALSFSLWHAGSGGGGIVFYAALGAWLAALYQRSGGRLWVPFATHCLWNLCVIVVRWQSM